MEFEEPGSPQETFREAKRGGYRGLLRDPILDQNPSFCRVPINSIQDSI